ncbi:MAG TPA: ATP-binding protein [Limnobacter sp.]|uniref:ATP-binding protein n=1 Tax=Limnobacter sp. TaxID=2003368 RepID=UPI002ED83DD0
MQLNEYLPHGFCINWNPFLLGLHVGSDLLIALAYFSIPVSLLWISKRQNLGSLQTVYYLFALFILACGVTHVMGIATLWVPLYLFEGYAKAFTALVSVATALYLIPKLKLILSLPNLQELIDLNDRLKREVAERQVIQQHLEKSMHEAIEAKHTQSKFLANMSHEIRTPMNGVVGASELLLHTPMDATQKDLIKTIRASGKALLNLLNDILDLSRVESGRFVIRKGPVKLEQLFEEVAESFVLEAEQKNIELICPFNPSFSTLIEADGTRLRQILFNLVGNAVKFTDAGHVQVTWSIREASHAADGHVLFVEVGDTGIGIAPQDCQRVFQRFKQASQDPTGQHRGGTGLGLTIVHELLEWMGGHIALDSVLGKGTRVEFSLPVRLIEQSDPATVLPASCRPRGQLGVWMSTDILQRYVESQLHHLGLGTCDGQSMLERLGSSTEPAQSNTTDLLFVSRKCLLNQPKVRERLQQLKSQGHLKVILIDQLSLKVAGESNAYAWVDASVLKPLSFVKLAEALKQVMGDGAAGSMVNPEHQSVEPALHQFEGRVVLAEDSPINQKIILGILKRYGVQAASVANGQQLIDHLKAHEVDLVIVDGQMPVLDGYEATRLIRRGECGAYNAHVPIVALTAHAMAGERQRCLELGMDEFLVKPLDVDEFIACLKRFLKTVPGDATLPSAV